MRHPRRALCSRCYPSPARHHRCVNEALASTISCPCPPAGRIKGYVGPIDEELAEKRARIEEPHRPGPQETEMYRIRFVTASYSVVRRGQAARLWRPRMA